MKTTQAAVKATFQVKGFITILVDSKKQLPVTNINVLHADITVGRKKHYLVADENIIVVNEDGNQLLKMPVEFTTKADSDMAAIEYAYSILNNIDKVSGEATTVNGQSVKFKSKSANVSWDSAEPKY